MPGEYISIENAKKIAACDEYRRRTDIAIEYINKRFTYEEDTGTYYLTHTFDVSNIFELLKILKGEKNEN